jgi:hypothetical protein
VDEKWGRRDFPGSRKFSVGPLKIFIKVVGELKKIPIDRATISIEFSQDLLITTR